MILSLLLAAVVAATTPSALPTTCTGDVAFRIIPPTHVEAPTMPNEAWHLPEKIEFEAIVSRDGQVLRDSSGFFVCSACTLESTKLMENFHQSAGEMLRDSIFVPQASTCQPLSTYHFNVTVDFSRKPPILTLDPQPLLTSPTPQASNPGGSRPLSQSSISETVPSKSIPSVTPTELATASKLVVIGGIESDDTPTGPVVNGLALSLTAKPLKNRAPGHRSLSLELRNEGSQTRFLLGLCAITSYEAVVTDQHGREVPANPHPGVGMLDCPADSHGEPLQPGDSGFLPVPIDGWLSFQSLAYTSCD